MALANCVSLLLDKIQAYKCNIQIYYSAEIILVNWVPKNSNYGNAVGQEYL